MFKWSFVVRNRKSSTPPSPPQAPVVLPDEAIFFDIFGCRGSRNLVPARSRIGNLTSCYSLSQGNVLFAFDAGRGLTALSSRLFGRGRFAAVSHVVVLVSHSHVDHWEGLKDAEWFWRRDNGLSVTVCGPQEALLTIQHGLRHPAFVPLEMLAEGTVQNLEFRTLAEGEPQNLFGWQVEPFSLHHYSGKGTSRRYLDALGYKVKVPGGPQIAYLCDHEPTPDTRAKEEAALDGCQLALYDSHFLRIADQMFGHGSIEHTALMAREHPGILLLAGHLSAHHTDAAVQSALRHFGKGLPNLHLAREDKSFPFLPPSFTP